MKIGQAYQLAFGSSLVEDIAKEYSGSTKKHTKALLVALASGDRAKPGNVDDKLVLEDARRLNDKNEKDRSMVYVDILSKRSYGHINALVDAYPKLSKKNTSLIQGISKKNSGSAKQALKTILGVARDPTAYFAEALYKALEGQAVGTHDTSLIRIVVTRAEVDLGTIEAIYASTYGHALQDRLAKSKNYLKVSLPAPRACAPSLVSLNCRTTAGFESLNGAVLPCTCRCRFFTIW